MADETFAELTKQFEKNRKAGEYDDQLNTFMDEVVDFWKGVAPVDTGNYRDTIQVIRPAKKGKGTVGAKTGYANIVEYGSEDTPEFAPRAKTRAHFNEGSSESTAATEADS